MNQRQHPIDGREAALFGRDRGATLAGMERAGRSHIESAAVAALRSTADHVVDGRGARKSFADIHIADAKRAARIWTELC